MSEITTRIVGWLIVCTSLATAVPALGADPSPDTLVKEIKAIRLPEFDLAREKEPGYLDRFKQERSKVRIHRAELIGQLYRLAPDHPRLAVLLPVRWRAYSGRMAGPDINEGARDLSGELNEVLTRSKDRALKVEAAYIKAWIASDPFDGMGAVKDKGAKARAIEEFIAFAPTDPRGAQLLYTHTICYLGDQDRQRPILARIAAEYPETKWAETARSLLRRFASVGKPFDLAFNDAISGAEVSTKKLRGKIIVINFWATWCGPCVAEMPKMKLLYETYHDRGVEFIGVSCDLTREEGGYDRLKAFVAKEKIPWPQYYGDSHEASQFADTWGINAIPAVFLVGRDGKLLSVDALGQLESLIREELKEKGDVR